MTFVFTHETKSASISYVSQILVLETFHFVLCCWSKFMFQFSSSVHKLSSISSLCNIVLQNAQYSNSGICAYIIFLRLTLPNNLRQSYHRDRSCVITAENNCTLLIITDTPHKTSTPLNFRCSKTPHKTHTPPYKTWKPRNFPKNFRRASRAQILLSVLEILRISFLRNPFFL